MLGDSTPRWQPGDDIKASQLNRLSEAAERASNVGVYGLDAFRGPSGTNLLARAPLGCWAKLTGNTGANYAWTQQVWDPATASLVDGPRSGTAALNPARNLAGVTDIAEDTVVWLRFEVSGSVWVFWRACP